MENRYILTPFFLDQPSPALEQLYQPDWEVNRVGLSPGDQQQRMTALHRPLAETVAEAVRQGQRPVSVAGDCCTSLAVLAGLQQAGMDPTLIWLDAHGDFNTWETTPSGFLGGMPLAMLVGRGEQTMVEGVGLRPLPEVQVFLSDARDLDPGEREALEGSAVHHLPDASELLDIPLPAGPIYVHFDADVLNPDDAPAMSYLAPGGPSAETLRRIFERLRESGQVVAVSLSAWNPELDEEDQSRKVVMGLLGELVAYRQASVR